MNWITLSAETRRVVRDEHGVPVEWTLLSIGDKGTLRSAQTAGETMDEMDNMDDMDRGTGHSPLAVVCTCPPSPPSPPSPPALPPVSAPRHVLCRPTRHSAHSVPAQKSRFFQRSSSV